MALAVAAVLAVFLLYTAVAGSSTPTVTPSELGTQQAGKLSIVGIVVGPLRGDAHGANGLRFSLRDPQGTSAKRVAVVYHGVTPPPLFKVGRSVVVSGSFAHGQLRGNDIVTKCPSKYTSSKKS